MIETDELIKVVELYPVLRELPATMQHSFRSSSYQVRMKAGRTVFESGGPIPFFLLLTSGTMRVVHVQQERELLLYQVQPGELCILSVCQLLTGIEYRPRAHAEQALSGVALPQSLFMQFVHGSPPFSSFLFQSFSRHLLVLYTLLESVSFGQLNERLASLLLSKGISVETTHSQLADELGSVREVISRILGEFERKGLVKLQRGKVTVLDRSGLEHIALSSGEKREW